MPEDIIFVLPTILCIQVTCNSDLNASRYQVSIICDLHTQECWKDTYHVIPASSRHTEKEKVKRKPINKKYIIQTEKKLSGKIAGNFLKGVIPGRIFCLFK